MLRFAAAALALLFVATAAFAAGKDVNTAVPAAPAAPLPPALNGDGSSILTGRVLPISSLRDIALNPGEVILTFDDGPRPGTTDSILSTLRAYGVKATFFMIGQNALRHPAVAQSVYLAGETIGSHTFDHKDLSKLSEDDALSEITRGDQAVQTALAPINGTDTPLFRFPYLAQTPLIRTAMEQKSYIPIGAQMDSDDYFTSSPQRLLRRILKELDHTGHGIILMHDIHERTALMLPRLLDALIARHYTVVQLVYKNGPMVQLRTAGKE
jgi:peptidoglycan/xylan/chitin deacetylase (PgdA/CDA1 family)